MPDPHFTAREALEIDLGAIVMVRLSEPAQQDLVLKYRAATNCTRSEAEQAVGAMRRDGDNFMMPMISFIALVGGSLHAFGLKDVAAGAVPDRTLYVLQDREPERWVIFEPEPGTLPTEKDAFALCSLQGDVPAISA